jgi:TusA-related sulfurtransferase
MPDSTTSSSPATAPSSGEASELDLRGEICPFTFVRTRLALEALPIGATLRVLVDHPPAARNVPRSAAEWGQEIRGVTAISDALWVIEVVKRIT